MMTPKIIVDCERKMWKKKINEISSRRAVPPAGLLPIIITFIVIITRSISIIAGCLPQGGTKGI